MNRKKFLLRRTECLQKCFRDWKVSPGGGLPWQHRRLNERNTICWWRFLIKILIRLGSSTENISNWMDSAFFLSLRQNPRRVEARRISFVMNTLAWLQVHTPHTSQKSYNFPKDSTRKLFFLSFIDVKAVLSWKLNGKVSHVLLNDVILLSVGEQDKLETLDH